MAKAGPAAKAALHTRPEEPLWWQKGVIYQIYPRSFQDSDRDGVGDLEGIRRRLDYLVDLGVDAIWISPIYPSPMADFGYDVADYTGIHKLFGSLADFDRLIADATARNLKVILDLVPNHTSDQHPWFVEARAGKKSPKRDWYIWRDPAADGGPPNNWLSEFGGSAWEYDKKSGQYYYHAFLASQPDLNWRNPQVAAAIHDAMRFWLDRGVAGFRVDVIWHMLKDKGFRDNPPNPDFIEGRNPYQRLLPVHTTDLDEVHGVIAGLRKVVDAYPDRLLIGEIYLPVERLAAYYGANLDGAHLPFNFALLEVEWSASAIADLIARYEKSLPSGGWPNWVLGNHDRPRVASRVGEDQARVAAMLLLSLRGTPTLYYGEEIGMRTVPIPADKVQDPFEKNVPGLGLGRDGVRTPMPWDGSPNGAFTHGTPWLPLDTEFPETNVQSQRNSSHSMLALYHALIRLRRLHNCLSMGDWRLIACSGTLLAYTRMDRDSTVLVTLNLGDEPLLATFPPSVTGRLLLSTFCDRDGERVAGEVSLRANEGVMVMLDAGVELPAAG
ncbi:alpha-amylase [Azorhizobium oxalatiphilum]|uniref:Alpha-amylase n=1 Tax=Azorhizobium oxalatiphilum TaxID=980631 RepID=A0A917BJ63_9HYPH|nr:alpha-amylase family glycosyl hydrolase [Azorhizobium oxalatiphilum]GGF47166.1 alpha-amylase [Azorhizobium oxalatiphilum]